MLRWWRKRQAESPERPAASRPQTEVASKDQTDVAPQVAIATPQPSVDPHGAPNINVKSVWKTVSGIFIPIPAGLRVEVVIRYYPWNFQAGAPSEARLPVLGWIPVERWRGEGATLPALVPIGVEVGPIWLVEEALENSSSRIESYTLLVDGTPVWRIRGSIISRMEVSLVQEQEEWRA